MVPHRGQNSAGSATSPPTARRTPTAYPVPAPSLPHPLQHHHPTLPNAFAPSSVNLTSPPPPTTPTVSCSSSSKPPLKPPTTQTPPDYLPSSRPIHLLSSTPTPSPPLYSPLPTLLSHTGTTRVPSRRSMKYPFYATCNHFQLHSPSATLVAPALYLTAGSSTASPLQTL